MAQILYILPECYVLPEPDPRRDQFFYVSDCHEGDILLPYWGRGDLAATNMRVRNFRYHVTHSGKLWGVLRGAWDVIFMVWRALHLHYRHKRFDVMIAYGTKPGLAGRIIKCLTGVKLIVELPGTPATRHLYNLPERTRGAYLRHKVSCWLVSLVLRGADHVRLGYPRQLDGFPGHGRIPSSVFHYFVPINSIRPHDIDGKYILSLGFPWYLKGVDILIKAFQQLADEFPDYRLKIIGHTYRGDREYFEKLRDGNPRIDFCKPVSYGKALELISSCSILVLSSRTESMGRVLLEAMAVRKPIVASRVGGIPHYIKDGKEGLLFEPDDIGDLASKLKRVLSDGNLAAELAKKGYETVHERYTEAAFAREFNLMIEAVLQESD